MYSIKIIVYKTHYNTNEIYCGHKKLFIKIFLMVLSWFLHNLKIFIVSDQLKILKPLGTKHFEIRKWLDINSSSQNQISDRIKAVCLEQYHFKARKGLWIYS